MTSTQLLASTREVWHSPQNRNPADADASEKINWADSECALSAVASLSFSP